MSIKQTVLDKVTKALDKKRKNNGLLKKFEVNISDSVFVDSGKSLVDKFQEELTKVSGESVFCNTRADLLQKLSDFFDKKKFKTLFCLDPDIHAILSEAGIRHTSNKDDFNQMDASITKADFLIARFGSVLVTSAQPSGRRLNVFPPCHIVVGYTSQLVMELDDAYLEVQKKYENSFPSMISVITGPSRTADIEKTLILGAHGPKEFVVFLVNDSKNL